MLQYFIIVSYTQRMAIDTHQRISVSVLQQGNQIPALFQFFLLVLKPLHTKYAPNERLKPVIVSPYRLSLVYFYFEGFLLKRFQRYYHLA